MSNPNFELLWYVNITMSQVIEAGRQDMAIQFLKNAKDAIAKVCPEAMQADELPAPDAREQKASENE